MDAACEPSVQTHTLSLDLFQFDRAFPSPLFCALTLLGDGACLVAVGGEPLPFAWQRDASVAIPRPNAAPAATSLANSASSSLALSQRLARRYNSQVFLSLDLSSLADRADRAMVPMEKALVQALDTVLERKKP
ncbi:hypothetical protein JCM3770_000804 [Rhodotorula araucariae]